MEGGHLVTEAADASRFYSAPGKGLELEPDLDDDYGDEIEEEDDLGDIDPATLPPGIPFDEEEVHFGGNFKGVCMPGEANDDGGQKY